MTITTDLSNPSEPIPADDSEFEAFRERVRTFIVKNAPDLPYRTGTRSPEDDHELALLRTWSAQLYAEGLVGADWPEEFGGRSGADPIEDFIVSEELKRAQAPVPIGAGSLVAHALITFGSPDQKRRFLPRIRSFEDVWCQLFSEPDAGSDLASLKTRATRDGDVYVVEGQKVWSTNAAFAGWGYLLARTDPDAVKHAGISAFVLDLSLPGIDVRPLREMTGTSDFNEVFLDGVRVPAEYLIGVENDGWRVATTSLSEERAGVGGNVAGLRQGFEALRSLARATPAGRRTAADDPLVRQALAGFATRIEIITLLARATVERRRRGEIRVQDAPIGKVSFAELNEEMADYGVGLEGAAGTLAGSDPDAVDGGRWQDELLYAKAYTISGGSNEIMRNILAERALGLPRT
ncbi:MAG: acyl-CoA dehydrogenase family protein [Ilumatobacteraceae bacterium]